MPSARSWKRRSFCGTSAIEAATLKVLREVATQMGAQKVARLTQLYEGEDSRLLDRLMAKSGSGELLTEPEVGEMGRLLATYPFAEFRNGTRKRRNSSTGTAGFRCGGHAMQRGPGIGLSPRQNPNPIGPIVSEWGF